MYIADLGFVLRTPTLRAGSQFRIADFKTSTRQKIEEMTAEPTDGFIIRRVD